MKKNDTVTLEITGTTAEGNGVGRHGGMAVFVPGAAEGDLLEVKILKVLKHHAFGKLISVLKASSDRVEPDCGVFGKCGGCAFRHISYEAECRIKQQRVADAFSRIGGLELLLRPIIGAKAVDGYRNKAQYPVGKEGDGALQIGFFAPRSHRIVDSRSCRLQPPSFTAALKAAEQWITQADISIYDESTGKGLLRHLYLRRGFATGEFLFVAVINGRELPHSELLVRLLRDALGDDLKSVQYNRNTRDTNVILGDSCVTVWGSDFITDLLMGLKIRISPLSFYQVNRQMAETLYAKAAEYAEPEGKILLDLYCGAGTIGLSMAKEAKEIIGVEIVESAVEDARRNAAANGIENAHFLCADAGKAAETLAAEGIRPNVVVVDPPRKGCSPELLTTIAEKFRPGRLVYVSCDPATLARDCKLLTQLGYRVSEATPVDLFPRTGHVETVVLMSRVKD